MQASGLTLFATAAGDCGVAWSPAGLCAVQLPEASRERSLQRLQRRLAAQVPGANLAVLDTRDAPAAVQRTVAAITQLLGGELAAGQLAAIAAVFAAATLDIRGISEPYQRIYAITRSVAPGSTITYGEIARALGDVAHARMVGQAMGRNPWPIVVPCHRVLGSDGTLTGFSAHGGVDTKRRLLVNEGVHLPHTPSLFDAPAPAMHARGPAEDAQPSHAHVRRDAAPDAHES